MSETILIKVAFPPGSLKKATTVKVSADSSVKTLTEECVASGKLTHPEDYHMYFTEGPIRWLEPTRLITFYGVKDQSQISLKWRWQILRIKFITANHQSAVQGLLVDVREPLKALLPYALKRFQLDSQPDHYVLVYTKGEKKDILPSDKSLLDVDLGVESEFILVAKNQPIPDAKAVAEHENKSKAPTSIQLSGTITFDKKKRYITIEGTTMAVYKDLKEMDKALQSTDLSEFALQVDEKEKKKLQFDIISTKNKKDLHQFKFDTEKELLTWLTSLEILMGSASAPAGAGGAAAASNEPSRVFGAPLERNCSDGHDVPYIVEHCIKHIEDKALLVEGIYRLSGSQVTIDKYRDQCNQGVQVDITNEIDPHTVAGLLKLYFREMPEPLLTFDLYDSFMTAQAETDAPARAKMCWKLIAKLPKVNKATLKYLISHLIRVEKHADVNKMAIHNLATVFAPNLAQSRDGDMLRMVEDTPLVNGLVNTFIKDFDTIFSEEEPPDAQAQMAKANYDYAAQSEKELSFKTGDLIRVIKQGEDKGWWFGEINNKKGLFPGAYVALVPQTPASAKAKFMQEMQVVRQKLAEEKKAVVDLEAEKKQLEAEIEALTTAKERAQTDQTELRKAVTAVLRANNDLTKFPNKVDVLYSQLEAYHKSRVAMQASRQALREELSALKKTVNTDPKFKKVKDKVVALIDTLSAKFDEEQSARGPVDEKKDQLLWDLMQLRTIVGPPVK